MSESMTVEHATELAKKFAALARANEDLCKHAIKQRDALQARVAELEAICENVPEGCTPADARVLREANHALVDEAAQAKWHKDIAEAALLSVEKERDGLLSQLPEGMKHCTIIFKECDKGHGWLTATNWVQHGCPKCEFDRIVEEKHELQRLRRQSSNMVSALHLEACQWRLKAEKAEQERDGLAAKCAELERQAQAIEDSETCAGAALMLVHDRFLRGVLTKEMMIDAANSVGTRSIARIKANAVRDAILALSAECDFKSGAIASVTGSGYWKTFSDWLEQKANQIEREGGV